MDNIISELEICMNPDFFNLFPENIEEEIYGSTGLGQRSYLKFSKTKENYYEDKSTTLPHTHQTIPLLAYAHPTIGGKTKKTKKIRKHKGIIQTGGNAGKLKKGYKYSGKILKSGKPQIIKISK